MGINDRDYIKDSNGKSSASGQGVAIDLIAILAVVAKSMVVLLALLFCLRFPSIWIKVPAAVAVGYFGWCWISGGKKALRVRSTKGSSSNRRTSNSERQKQQSAIERYQAAVDRLAKPDQNAVRLLAAYDAAGEFGKAKTLIQSLDGAEFAEPVAKELAALVKNYFPSELEPTETGVRFKLAKVE